MSHCITTFPDDYLLFMKENKSRRICDWIRIHDHLDLNGSDGISYQSELCLSYLVSHEAAGQKIYALNAPIIVWGTTDDGGKIGWPNKNPNRTIIITFRPLAHQKFDFSFGEFLTKLLSGEVQSDLLPDDLLE